MTTKLELWRLSVCSEDERLYIYWASATRVYGKPLFLRIQMHCPHMLIRWFEVMTPPLYVHWCFSMCFCVTSKQYIFSEQIIGMFQHHRYGYNHGRYPVNRNVRNGSQGTHRDNGFIPANPRAISYDYTWSRFMLKDIYVSICICLSISMA